MANPRWRPSRFKPNPDPDPEAIMATCTFRACGCEIHIRMADLPLQTLVCDHGNYWTAAAPGSGSVIVGTDVQAPPA